MFKTFVMMLAMTGASVYAASPGATQQWVKNYVASNSTAGVTEERVREIINEALANSGSQSSAGYSSNTVSGILANLRVSRLAASVSNTNFAYRTEYSPAFPNLDYTVLVCDYPNTNFWYNAPTEGFMTISNGTESVFAFLGVSGEAVFTCDDFKRNSISVFVNGTNTMSVSAVTVSEYQIKKARGE